MSFEDCEGGGGWMNWFIEKRENLQHREMADRQTDRQTDKVAKDKNKPYKTPNNKPTKPIPAVNLWFMYRQAMGG